jgi:DNA-binding transcriptional ArsR family regulator
VCVLPVSCSAAPQTPRYALNIENHSRFWQIQIDSLRQMQNSFAGELSLPQAVRDITNVVPGGLHLDRCSQLLLCLKLLPGPLSLYTLTRICSVEYTKRVEPVFDIIAELNRRAILSLLVSSQLSVGEIGRQLHMPQPTVSKHLRVLREADFVESTVDAQCRLYRLKPEPLQEIDAWLAPFRRFWSAHVDALERHLDCMESVNTNEKEDKEKTTRPKPRT